MVLPGATATEFWNMAGTPLEQLPDTIVMTADNREDATDRFWPILLKKSDFQPE